MLKCEIVELGPQPAAVVHGTVPVQEMPEFFGQAFGSVMAFLGAQGASPVGPPFGFYPSPPGEVIEVYAGFPVAAPLPSAGEVEMMELPGGRAATATHVGPYDTLEQTYHDLLAWMTDQGVKPAPAMWESYLSDPGLEPPEQWRTNIIWPIAE